MTKLEEWHGLWWLPEKPANKVPGWLRSSTDGRLRLELSGAFLESARVLSGDKPSPTRIVGQLETLPAATLENCLLRNHAAILFAPRETWHVGEAVIGAQFSADEPWQFHGAAFSIPGLTRWVSLAVVEQSYTVASGPTRFGIAATADSLPLWSWNGHQVNIERSLSTGTAGEYVGTLSAECHAWTHGGDALSKQELFDKVVAPLQLLIALATGEFTAAISGRAYVQPFRTDGRNESCEWRWSPHDISLNPESARYGFNYGDVQALGADVWNRWVSFWQGRETVKDLYLAAIRQSGFAELSFLLAAQALETLHRNSEGTTTKPMESEKWTLLRGELKETLKRFNAPEVMSNKIGYLNDPTLRTRLQGLGSQLGVLLPRISGDDNPDNFFKKVTRTRNYFTHWEGNDGIFRQGEQTYHATERLLAMLEVLLLRELGFGWDSAAIVEVLRRRVDWLPVRS